MRCRHRQHSHTRLHPSPQGRLRQMMMPWYREHRGSPQKGTCWPMDAAPNPSQGRSVDVLSIATAGSKKGNINVCSLAAEDEICWDLSPTFTNDVAQCLSVIGILCNRLAEVERLSGPVVYNQLEVVGCDSASDSVSALLDSLDRLSCRRMLEHDLEFWELAVDLEQVRQELLFGV